MKSKSLEMSDYPEIRDEIRSLLRAEAEFRGDGVVFNIPHMHRYWEYGSALAALREAGIAPPARVLDVGSGHGPFGPWLAKLHYRVDEIDPSPNVENRKELGAKLTGLDWAFAGTPLVNFKPSTPYDAVFAISVMEHIPPAEQAASWSKLMTLVKPGGLLFATVDYGARESANESAREMIFGSDDILGVEYALKTAGFTVEALDDEFHGAQVFDYTFFRVIARRAA